MGVWAKMDRDARIGAIWRMAREKLSADRMADRMGTAAQHIRKLARDEGITIPKAVFVRHQNDPATFNDEPTGNIWEKSEAERRYAVWEKARRAAKATRESNPVQ